MAIKKTVRFADDVRDTPSRTRGTPPFGRLWLLEKLFNDLPEAQDAIIEDIEEVPVALLDDGASDEEPASPTAILTALIAAGSDDAAAQLPLLDGCAEPKNDKPCDFCEQVCQDICFRCPCGGVLCCDCYLKLIEDGTIACRSCFDVRQVDDDDVSALQQLFTLAADLEALATTTPTTNPPNENVTRDPLSEGGSTTLMHCGNERK